MDNIRSSIFGFADEIYAANGPITRVACWIISRAVGNVLRDSSADELTELGPGATLVVRGKGEKTIVVIRQTRKVAAIWPSW
ncbi:MAG: hypothetical protein ACI80V_001351 [Rhodothermales bacterium]|jgi:hypothetical protein